MCTRISECRDGLPPAARTPVRSSSSQAIPKQRNASSGPDRPCCRKSATRSISRLSRRYSARRSGRQGHLDEAWEYTRISEQTSSRVDVISDVGWRVTPSSHRQRSRRARECRRARDRRRCAGPRDRQHQPPRRRVGGRSQRSRVPSQPDGRAAALQEALSLYDAKGNVVSAAVTREAIARTAIRA